VTTDAADFGDAPCTNALLYTPKSCKQGIRVVRNPEIRPSEVLMLPGRVPPRVEIEAVVGRPLTSIRID
jgi:hypothetical protein